MEEVRHVLTPPYNPPEYAFLFTNIDFEDLELKNFLRQQNYWHELKKWEICTSITLKLINIFVKYQIVKTFSTFTVHFNLNMLFLRSFRYATA